MDKYVAEVSSKVVINAAGTGTADITVSASDCDKQVKVTMKECQDCKLDQSTGSTGNSVNAEFFRCSASSGSTGNTGYSGSSGNTGSRSSGKSTGKLAKRLSEARIIKKSSGKR